jgi:hypothetical protein
VAVGVTARANCPEDAHCGELVAAAATETVGGCVPVAVEVDSGVRSQEGGTNWVAPRMTVISAGRLLPLQVTT